MEVFVSIKIWGFARNCRCSDVIWNSEVIFKRIYGLREG